MRTTLLRRKQRDFPDRALSSATGQRPANKAACILELGGGETWKLGLDDAVTSAQQHSRDTPRKATLPKNFLGNAVSLHRSFIELPVKYYIGN